MVPDRIVREIHVDAPVERVWAVLTRPEHIAEWFGDTATVDLRQGGALTLGWAAYGTFHAAITRVEEPRVLAYRWAADTDVEPGYGNSTLVEFTLAADGDGTLLRVIESGFADLARSPEQQGEHARENAQGWEQELGELKVYAEK